MANEKNEKKMTVKIPDFSKAVEEISEHISEIAGELIQEELKDLNPDQVNLDLTSVLRGQYIFKTWDLTKNFAVTMRDLKTADIIRIQNICAIRDEKGNIKYENGRPVLNPAIATTVQLAMSIVAMTGYDDLPDIPRMPSTGATPEEIEAFFKCLSDRQEIIRNFPPTIYDWLVQCMMEIIEYVKFITNPEKLRNF